MISRHISHFRETSERSAENLSFKIRNPKSKILPAPRLFFRRAGVLLFLAAGMASAAPEQVLSLNLEDAVRMALGKNFQIRAARFTPQIARARQLSASGKFDPVAGVSVTYDEKNQELRTLNNELVSPVAVPGGETPDLFARTSGLVVDSSIAGLSPWGLTLSLIHI